MTDRDAQAGFRYWAFISYSHQDLAWGRWLHRALESYRIPRHLVGMPILAGNVPSRLTPIFRDRDELAAATDLGFTIEQALRLSHSLIVICSPAAAQSRWVNQEVLEFIKLGRAARIFCLIVGGSEAAPLQDDLPPALIEEIRAGREPVIADARRHADGRRHAKLKLIASVLDISYARLVQREQHRHHQRLLIVACTSLLAFGLMATFLILTINSRREAVAQRSHAEGLVEFMLGDLRHRLEPERKLETLDAVGREALAYYAAQDPHSLDAEALARRARALHMIGEVSDLRGRLDEALKTFEQAAESTGELLARDEDNPQRLFDHAQSVFWVGYIAWQRGHSDTAKQAFEQYKSLATRLVAINPDNETWQAELGYADSNLGTLLLDHGDVNGAISAFSEAMRIAQRLSLSQPTDVSRQAQAAQAHAWLASALYARGSLHEASAQRGEEIAIYESMLAVDAKNNDARRALSIAEGAQAMIALNRGQIEVAATQLRRAVELAGELVQRDKENTEWAEAGFNALASLGEVLDFAGDRAGARDAISGARDIAAELVARDSGVIKWQMQFARGMLLQAKLLAADGDVLGALRLMQGAIQRLQSLQPDAIASNRRRSLLAQLWLQAGEQSLRLQRLDEAQTAWSQVINLLRPDGDVTNAEPDDLAVLASALLHGERASEAVPIIARLAAIGFRRPDYLRVLASAAVASKVEQQSAASTH